MELREQQFCLDADGSECFVGDAGWTSEAITNILKNCMEHTPKGGSITVTVLENALYSQIVIEDTGKGLRPQDLRHIFERFYKGADSARESVGIGLALSKTIILKQNGTIQAKNRKEGGAQFVIRFYKRETI
jgi:signal transduction histidine kinase